MARRAKELNLHRHEVRILAQFDRLLAECSRHDEDVLSRSLEVDLKRDRLLLIELEECNWFEVTQGARILDSLLLPRLVVLKLEVSEDICDLKGLKRV